MTHICVSKLTINGSDNGLSPGRRQAIIWTNDGILLIRSLLTNFREILLGIQTFPFKKMHLIISSAKLRPFCLGRNVLNNVRDYLSMPYAQSTYIDKRGPWNRQHGNIFQYLLLCIRRTKHINRAAISGVILLVPNPFNQVAATQLKTMTRFVCNAGQVSRRMRENITYETSSLLE